ncbi:MAG: methyltransferase domain-containing protein [Candidatus Gottesmanbacteria bacterium]|nr:methyltransferase domain-containing protein [Candidatus Gottesmanbacteria bacterium]
MSINFYDKVAKKFGGYAFSKNHIGSRSECPKGDPEKIFKKKLLGLATNSSTAFDAGCGDGKFAFQIAKHFLRIIGIDTSKELLKIAKQKQKIFHVANISFRYQNADDTSFPDASFDIIFSRRGSTAFSEFHRLLKFGGYYIGIEIGEKDCQEIKEIFGRGQGYKEWDTSRLKNDKRKLNDVGFEVVSIKDYFCDEYFKSYKDFDLFLQGVPIFENFNSEKDRKLLEEYVAEFTTEKGIRLQRHRVVLVAKKM